MSLPRHFTHEHKLEMLVFEGRSNVYGPEVGRDALVRYEDLAVRSARCTVGSPWPRRPDRMLFYKDEHLHDRWLWGLSQGVVDFDRVEIVRDADFIRREHERDVPATPLEVDDPPDPNDEGPYLIRAYGGGTLYEAFTTSASATQQPWLAVRFMNMVLWHQGRDERFATAYVQDHLGHYTLAVVASEEALPAALDEAAASLGPHFRRYR